VSLTQAFAGGQR